MHYSLFVVNASLVPCIDIPILATFCEVIINDSTPPGFLFNDGDITVLHHSIFNPTVPVLCTSAVNNIECIVGDFLPGDYVEVLILGTADAGLLPGTELNNFKGS